MEREKGLSANSLLNPHSRFAFERVYLVHNIPTKIEVCIYLWNGVLRFLIFYRERGRKELDVGQFIIYLNPAKSRMNLLPKPLE